MLPQAELAELSSPPFWNVKSRASDHKDMVDDDKKAELLRKRLAQAFADKPGMTQAALAEVCGVTPQAVSGWKKTGQVDPKHFPTLVKAFGKPLEYWHGAQVPMRAFEVRGVEGEAGVDKAREVMVAVVDVELAAGEGQPIEFVETRYRLPYQIEWLRSVGVRKPDDVRLMAVRGASMEPVLWDGDKVLIHTTDTRIASDAVFAILFDGEPRVKRLFNTAAGVRVVSDNPDKQRYPDELVTPEQADRLVIVGRAIHRQGSKGL
jgi:phage repressor protein C with HTH and peptisase S24 domain